MARNIVPMVIQEPSSDIKHAILVEEVYSYFSTEYGTKEPKKKHGRRKNKLACKVSRAKELTKEARKQLQNAKRASSIPPDQVMLLARNFYQHVRAHSQLSKQLHQSVQSASPRTAKDQCHTNIWWFCKRLLDKKSASDVEPTFSEAQATELFTKAYHAEL